MPVYRARSGYRLRRQVLRAPLHMFEPDQRDDTSLFYDPSHGADPAFGNTA
jgi:hypothetical protein